MTIEIADMSKYFLLKSQSAREGISSIEKWLVALKPEFFLILKWGLLRQDVWLTIFFVSKQLVIQSFHDQDQIWWKGSNSSLGTFLEKVDLSKIVNLAWTDLTLAWTYQKQIDLFSHQLFFFGNVLKKGWFYQDCLIKYEKNYKSIMIKQDLLIFWRGLTLNGENPNFIMPWNWCGIYLRPKGVKYKICWSFLKDHKFQAFILR